MYVCICKGITDKDIQEAAENGLDFRRIRDDMGLATDCGQCCQDAKRLVRETQARSRCEFYSAA